MSSLARTRRIRWAAPFVVAAVIGMVAFVPTLSASATPSLAPLTTQDLLIKVQQANVKNLSGSITLTTNLGIPDLSQLSGLAGQGSGFNPTDLLSGSHTAQIWVAGPDLQRIALPTSLAETDVIHNGNNVWVWQSAGSKVTHVQGTPGQASAKAAEPATAETPTVETPAQLAAKVLAQVDPSTLVTVGKPGYVANHAVYVLDLAPRSSASTIAHVDIAVDAANGLPLKVSVWAKGQPKSVALALGFSSVKFSRPATSTFSFTPPPGSKVTNKTIAPGTATKAPSAAGHASGTAGPTADKGTQVVGTGWDQVLIATTSGGLSAGPGSGPGGDLSPNMVLNKAAQPVSGSWGSGRLLETNLVNVLVLDNGRIAVGAVSPAALESAVASAH
jgi:outer membrane lipoprotein-sorting protein